MQQHRIPLHSSSEGGQSKSYNDQSPMQSMHLNRYNFDYTSPQAFQLPDQQRDSQFSYGIKQNNNEIPLNQTPSQSQSNWMQQTPIQGAFSEPKFVKNNTFTTPETLRTQPQPFISMPQNPQMQQQNNFHMMNQLLNQNQPFQNEQSVQSQAQIQQQLLQSQLLQQQLLQLLQSQQLQPNQLAQAQLLQQQQQQQQEQSRNKFAGTNQNPLSLSSQTSLPQFYQQQPQNPLLIQALLQSGTMTPQQKLPTYPQSVAGDSYLNTPLESSRYPSNEVLPQNFSQTLQQQQQLQSSVNYSQFNENLSQYKKLISYLESIDSSKARTAPQPQPQIQHSQSQFLPVSQMSVPSTQRHDHSSYEPQTFQDTLQRSNISASNENSKTNITNQTVMWPSQVSSEISQKQSQPINWQSSQQQSMEQPRQTLDKFTENVQDSYNEGRVQNVSVSKINNFIESKDSQISQHQLSEADTSKVSGDMTKESFTDIHYQQHLQMPHHHIDLNKSINESLHNQSQMSESRSQRQIGEEGASSRLMMRSQEHTYLQEDREDKPIANNQLTFEELLESKLQECGGSNAADRQPLVKPKRDFLRKNSQARTQTSNERAKSKTKYKYYADNFNNNNTEQQVQQEVNTQNNRTKMPSRQNHQSSPGASKRNQAQSIESTPHSKKYQTSQKSTQRQPTQQQNKSPHGNRPQSSQQVSNSALKQSATRSRQTPHINNLNNLAQSKTTPTISKKDETEAILTDRNSIAEFEMLEQECIAKCQQSETSLQSLLQPIESQPLQMVEQTKNSESNTVVKEKQSQLDSKIKELDREIMKFQKENQRVTAMQVECEQSLKRLTAQIEEFEARKEKDIEEIVQWKEEEMLEIRQMRAQLDQEIQEFKAERQKSALKRKSSQTQEEELARENERLMKIIHSLTAENTELKDKIDELTDKEYKIAGTQTDAPSSLIQESTPKKKELRFADAPNQVQIQDMIEPEDVIEEDVDNESKTSSVQEEEEEVKRELTEEHHIDETEESEEDEYDLKFPSQYHGKEAKQFKMTEEIIGADGKIQRIYENGKKEVVFTNGVTRVVWPDGYSIVDFNNNDIKQTFPDGKIVYYFSEAKTTQTTFPNGLQVFKFANSQIEKHFIDGTKEISFPDGTIKCLFPDGEEESIFPDGTIQKIEKSGIKIIEFPNGQRDVVYPDGIKLREFPDGTVKKIYTDGRTEVLPPKKKQMPIIHQGKQMKRPVQK